MKRGNSRSIDFWDIKQALTQTTKDFFEMRLNATHLHSNSVKRRHVIETEFTQSNRNIDIEICVFSIDTYIWLLCKRVGIKYQSLCVSETLKETFALLSIMYKSNFIF
ncbi:unnamed protein product [Albugo candida]|uniref:Uncharacterized protein n=1 Tax=Albugo candida TaxID=65357 RepID=A0A024FTI0_9STRA|nr:unnamed protein product [Albugo candida]|eukprot:CCI10418.1 unnamed protein product [Albugo candida]